MIDEEMAGACFANRLRSATRAMTRVYDGMLKPLDLRVSQASVLAAVSLGGGRLTIAELAARLAMDRSTLSRNFDPLERRGLVALGPEERHRARKVTITEAGAALLADAYPLWRAAQALVAEAVPDMAETALRMERIARSLG
jgi:DNA-binding MarR family transcriptional regulator